MKELGARAVLQELRMNVLSNNLANINTSGFKEDAVAFRIPSQGFAGSSNEKWIMDPYQTAATRIHMAPGQLRETGNPLDLSIHGNGFFCINTASGEEYTRNGSFTVDGQGRLVTPEGFPVLGRQGQEIRLEAGFVHVDDAGNITVDGVPSGRLRIVQPDDPGLLRKSADTRFSLPEDAVLVEMENPVVKQGFLESSNVNSIRAMTDMIEVLRGYETYHKIIHVLNEANQKSINEVGKLK